MKKLKRRRRKQQESRLAVDIERAALEREQKRTDDASSNGYSEIGYMVPNNVIPPASVHGRENARPLSPLEKSPHKKSGARIR